MSLNRLKSQKTDLFTDVLGLKPNKIGRKQLFIS